MDLATGLALLESDYYGRVCLQIVDVLQLHLNATFGVYRVVRNVRQARPNRDAVSEYRDLSSPDSGVYRCLFCSRNLLFASFGDHLVGLNAVLEIDLEIVVGVYVPCHNPSIFPGSVHVSFDCCLQQGNASESIFVGDLCPLYLATFCV